MLALVGLLQFKDAWPSAGPDRDRVAAARYLEVPVERMLAYGTLGDSRKERPSGVRRSIRRKDLGMWTSHKWSGVTCFGGPCWILLESP